MIAWSFVPFALAAGVAAPAEGPTPIYGGETVGTCAWPTTVSLGENCSGTLIHPELVVYASHCGPTFTEVVFGEDFRAPQRAVPVQRCAVHPEGGIGAGRDIAFCRLAAPVLDVPIVPVLFGCETDALTIGRKVALVGYGVAEGNAPFGPKRAVTTPIVQWFGDEIFIGSDGKDACNGDSGGPAFIRLAPEEDAGQAWRVFGVVSYGSPCGEGTYFTLIHKNIDWLESESGVDVTPCHDADGTWAPTARCGSFPIDAEVAQGEWSSGCSAGAVTGWSQTCGAAFSAPSDTEPPEVAIVTPGDGSVFASDTPVKLLITAEASDAGWGLQDLRLRINGKEVDGTLKVSPPFTYPDPLLQFKTGTWALEAVARDLAGNEAVSQVVTFEVVPEDEPGSSSGAPTTSAGSSGEGSDSSGESSGSSGSATGDQRVDDEGCGCRGGAGGGPLGLLLVALRRRRRRA